MTWNYRVIKHDMSKPAYFAIHEVFYDEDSRKITNWTAEPIELIGDSKSDVSKVLKQMVSDVSKLPVLKESELASRLK